MTLNQAIAELEQEVEGLRIECSITAVPSDLSLEITYGFALGATTGELYFFDDFEFNSEPPPRSDDPSAPGYVPDWAVGDWEEE